MTETNITRKILGTWKLAKWQVELTDGRVSYPFGTSPVGYLNYGEEGYMSVMLKLA